MKFTKTILLLLFVSFGLFSFQKNEPKADFSYLNLFLDNYYSINKYNLGKSIEVKTTTENLLIYEITSSKSKNKIGYVVNEKLSNEPLYFVDIKKENKKILVKEIKENNSTLISFNKDEDFQKFYDVDIIEELKKIDTPLETEKFWGKSRGPAWTITGSDCYQNCCYYIFWIQNGCWTTSCDNGNGNL